MPFTFTAPEKLKRRARFFTERIGYKKNSRLAEELKNSGVNISREEYIGIIIRTFFITFIFLLLISTTILALFKIDFFYVYGFGFSFLFSCFISFSQIVYPRIYVARKQRDIEKNLISALQDISVQLNSGISLFGVMTNISDANYGELSEEFRKAVKRINSGEPETDVLDDLAKRNPSVFFRRTLWQVSNGMRAGGDISTIIKDSIKALNEEQLIQVQNYGNKLNPLIMFYMLISVIIPALSITFLTVLSSMINIGGDMTALLFIGLSVFVVLVQIMFLGLVKSRRPSLL